MSDDGDELLLGPTAKSGKASHRLPLDDRLRAAMRGQLATPGSDRAQIELTPKEIQSRLRAGETPEEVAKAAGVPVARVQPYAVPVIAERQRIVDDARAALLHRTRGPSSLRPLGEAVDGHLNDVTGLRPDTVEWTARRRRDGAWIVSLSYAARGGRRAASWLWRPLERDLTALDISATRLAADEGPVVRRRAAAPRPAAKRPAARKAKKTARKTAKKTARKAAAKRAPAKKAPARRAPAQKAPAKRAVAKRAPAKKAAVKRAPAKRAPVKKVAVKKVAAKRAPVKPVAAKRPAAKRAPSSAVAGAVRALAAKNAAAKRAAAERAAAKKAAASKATTKKAGPTKAGAKKAAPAERPLKIVKIRPEVVEPVPFQEPVAFEEPTVIERPVVVEQPVAVEQPAEQRAARPVAARRAGQRVPIPSWSDVLLGVQPPPREPDDAEPSSAPARRRRKG